MRYLVLAICLFANVGFGLERAQLDVLLQTAATNRGPEYLTARSAITYACMSDRNLLVEAANDKLLTWQQRLAARIAYERMVRMQDIEALRNYDWGKHPAFEERWRSDIVGPVYHMRDIVLSEMARTGLWYYFIELTWKGTPETCTSRIPRLKGLWAWWCRTAVVPEPEHFYLNLAMLDRVVNDGPFVDEDRIYEALMKDCKEAVPVLVTFFDQYNKKKTGGRLESYHGENAERYVNQFAPIIALADNRHVDLLQKFMAEHAPLASMTNRLVEVQARSATPVPLEPSFRLGTNLVVVAPKSE